MEFLRDIFPTEIVAIEQMLATPMDISLMKSILFGTMILILALWIHYIIWDSTELAIMDVGYHGMTLMQREEWHSRCSVAERIFMIKLTRNVKYNRSAVWFYWFLGMLNYIAGLVSIVLWIGTIIIRRKAWMWWGLKWPIVFWILVTIATYIPDLLYDPDTRRRHGWRP